MSHFDTITEAPSGARGTASTADTPAAAFGDPDRRIYGVQFHPEVAHTEHGQDILKTFLYDVAGCRPTWTTSSIIEEAVAEIREQVGTERVICGLSGGVDSAVAAALVHKAVGDQLTCVFVDTGLLRKGEAEQVEETFRSQFHVDLVHVKAGDRFLGALDDVTEPERKRKIIGETFIRVFEEVAREHDDPRFLVQGTLYPDVVESGGGDNAVRSRATTTSAACPRTWSSSSSSRCGHLFKDEVRGRRGARPARGDRVAPAVPGPRARRAHHRHDHAGAGRDPAGTPTRSCSRRSGAPGSYREIWQSFAVLPAVRSVGVQGDDRTYAYPIILRAVTSDDAMTADWARLPYDVLERIVAASSTRSPGVNRVAYDITSKPPGTIEWE